jgi:hypothetical protein
MIADWCVKWHPSLYRKVLLHGSIRFFTRHKLLHRVCCTSKCIAFFFYILCQVHSSSHLLFRYICVLNMVHECYYYILSLKRDTLLCYKNAITEQLVLKCCWSVHEVIQLCELTHTHYHRESLFSVVSSDEEPVNPFQPSDAMWHHIFHLSLISMFVAHWFQYSS